MREREKPTVAGNRTQAPRKINERKRKADRRWGIEPRLLGKLMREREKPTVAGESNPGSWLRMLVPLTTELRTTTKQLTSPHDPL